MFIDEGKRGQRKIQGAEKDTGGRGCITRTWYNTEE